jgi:hypothetical protein
MRIDNAGALKWPRSLFDHEFKAALAHVANRGLTFQRSAFGVQRTGLKTTDVPTKSKIAFPTDGD